MAQVPTSAAPDLLPRDLSERSHSEPGRPRFDLPRLTALIDGVYAVAMTLLILDLRLPQPSGDLVSDLRALVPSFVSYLIVFASVAGYWFLHHLNFRFVGEANAPLVVLSLVNLAFVTLFPVAASIVGAYPLEPLATVCLSANASLYCATASATWTYAASHPQLIRSEPESHLLRRAAGIMAVVAVELAAAIPLAFVSPFLAYAIWLLSAPIGALAARRFWPSPATPEILPATH